MNRVTGPSLNRQAFGCRREGDAEKGSSARRVLARAALLATTILISGSSRANAEPRITEVKMGEDVVQKADGYQSVHETTAFRPDSPKIVCIFKVEGASIGMSFKGVWIAEDVGAAAPPNYKIMEKSVALPFLHNGSLTLTRPDKGWPVGSYRLDIYFGSTLAKTVNFTVKGKS